jgi:hypothetical protein
VAAKSVAELSLTALGDLLGEAFDLVADDRAAPGEAHSMIRRL